MPDTIIESKAPNPATEVAEIEKALVDKTESAKITEESKAAKTAFEELADKKNFESVDDLVDAYKNLESTMNPTRKELKELKEMVKGIQDSTKPEVKDPFDDLPKEQREAMDLLETLLDRKLNSKLSPLLKKVEVDEASQRITAVRKKFPGVNDGELDTAISIMEKFPEMVLEDAVKIASYERASKGATASSTRTETERKNKRAFSESAANARTGDNTDYSKLTIDELEEILNIPNHAK